MFLTHRSIEQLIKEDKLVIKPEFDFLNIRPVGIRVHLAKDILVPKPNQIVEIGKTEKIEYQEVDLTKEDFFIEPNQFILGATYEAIKTPPNILMLLDGRSTIARLGLTTHITASVIDGTFEKPHVATLEIKNVGNFRIKLNYKDPIAMMLFAELKEDVTQKIQSQYGSGQNRVTPPNLKFKTGIDK